MEAMEHRFRFVEFSSSRGSYDNSVSFSVRNEAIRSNQSFKSAQHSIDISIYDTLVYSTYSAAMMQCDETILQLQQNLSFFLSFIYNIHMKVI